MEELHNHTGNAEKFKGVLDDDASIYQQRETKTGREQMAGMDKKGKWEFFKEYYAKKLLVVMALILVAAQVVR
ncbi:MAG: hypothetical protein LUI07_08205, partial [Lachnospiraceae bacterium]|nr:hypothetical protein [Lachnospiraceae bacterium]